MTPGRSDTRAELSRLLYADAQAGDDSPKAPDETASAHLHELISLGIIGSLEDQRAVYEHLPLLMLRIFGFTSGTGWLETGSSLGHAHREALMNLVRPSGPVVEYCAARSPPLGSEPKDDEWRFEYPLSNFPSILIDEFYDAADQVMTLPSHFLSALAPTLGTCLRRGHDGAPDVLLLSPIDYFYLCMVASPTQKWTTPLGPSYLRRPRPRRSVSLPSTRSMYNLVLTEHVTTAWRSSPLASGGGKSILIPSCIDCLFAPLSGAMYSGLPEASTPTVDAMAAVLVALRPSCPNDLVLSNAMSGQVLYPAREPATALLYAMTHEILRNTFSSFPVGVNGPLPTLASFVRLLALYLSPGSEAVITSLKSALYPKPRAQNLAAGASPSLAAFHSTLSSLNAQLQLPAQALRSNANSTAAKQEAVWRTSSVFHNRRDPDRELLRLAVVKCANSRMGSIQDGVRALTTLAGAVRASGLGALEGSRIETYEEAKASLRGLSEQVADYDARAGVKSKAFVPILGSGLGIKLESAGMFSGMVDIVHSTAHRVSHVTGSSNGKPARRLRERRKSELFSAYHEQPVLLGSVWDHPIDSREYEFAVVHAYKLATVMEAKTGLQVPGLRYCGRKIVVHVVISILFLCWLVVHFLG
jgi:hypothetical protein